MDDLERQLGAWTDAVVDGVSPVTVEEARRVGSGSSVPPVEGDRRSGPSTARWALAAAAIVVAVLAAATVPAEAPLHRLIGGPDEVGPPATAPPADPRAGWLAVSPDPDGGVRAGGTFIVSLTGGATAIVDNGVAETTWERWDGTGWEPTHRLTSSADPGAYGLNEGADLGAPDEPTVAPYEEPGAGTFETLAGVLYAEPLPFRAPDVGPGIYRVCFDVDGPDGGGGGQACPQLRFPGEGVPPLRTAAASADELDDLPLTVPWALDPASVLVADLSEVVVVADANACGNVDVGSIQPSVVVTEDTVTITLHADALPGGMGMCDGGTRPVTVALGELLGERTLVDGSCGDPGAVTDEPCAAGTTRRPGG